MRNLEADSPGWPRRSVRTRRAPVRYGYEEYAETATHRVHHVAYHLSGIDEPTTIQEARSGDHAAEWKVATDSEYNSLIENKTWRLVELPPERKAVGCKWVFTPETLLRWSSGTIQSTPSGQGLNPEIWYRLWWNLFARSSYLSNTLFASVCSSEWFADSPDGRRNSFSQR